MGETQVREPVRHHCSRVILNLVVLAVAAHSIALGIALLFFPLQMLGLIRWEYTGQVFWPSQAGLLLVILGAAYAAAIRLRPLVWLVIGSKASAVIFLLVSAIWVDAPQIAAVLACGDGLMGLAVAAALWQLKRSERSVPKLIRDVLWQGRSNTYPPSRDD